MTSGTARATPRIAATIRAAVAGSSTLAGRWSVATPYGPASSSRPRAAATSNRSRLASSVSIIGLPTKWTRPRSIALAGEIVDGLGARGEQQVATGHR